MIFSRKGNQADSYSQQITFLGGYNLKSKKIKKLSIRERDVCKILQYTKSDLPNECCGLLLGKFKEDEAIVESIHYTPNEEGSSVRFSINPELLLQILENAEREGKELIGIFHSHPASAFPSLADKKYMKLWPNTIWLIIGIRDEMKAFFYGDKGIYEANLNRKKEN